MDMKRVECDLYRDVYRLFGRNNWIRTSSLCVGVRKV